MLGTHLGTQTKKGQRNEPLTCTFMVAGAGFEPTTFWVMNESSWRLHKFSLVYLVWIHFVE